MADLRTRYLGLELRSPLVASTGVHRATDVVKVLLAGADVAMMTSALLRDGPDHLRRLETQVRDWMDRHGFETRRAAPGPAQPAVGPRPGRLRAGQLHQDPRLPPRAGVDVTAASAMGRP
jgi:hypothetical protein